MRPRRSLRARGAAMACAHSHSGTVLRTLTSVLPGEDKVVGSVDECDMGEGLREITREPLGFRIIFLSEKSHIIAETG